MRNAFVLAVLLCLTTTAGAVSSMYRWVDKDGNVHYGDDAPAGIQVQLVAPAAALSTAPTDEEIAAAQARAEKCKNLQTQLANYSSAAKLTETDALGNVREYSEDEKKKLLALTQAKVDEACSGVSASAAAP